MLDTSAALWALSALWLASNAVVVLSFRGLLWRIWREPVFRHPILVIESDDWGAGPLAQEDALREIADVMVRHRDTAGRSPTLNIALVLAVPDGPAIEVGGVYRRVELDATLFRPVRAALLEGQRRGVFALQLHGMEHYCPQALMESQDEAVRQWLRQPAPAVTEQLPSHLQSRWVDGRTLPSVALGESAVRAAVADEVHAYTRIVGVAPKLVVPPTFVWTRVVEQSWLEHGVDVVVTPGWRSTQRNARGLPDADEGPLMQGGRAGNLLYLVRTDYFEPVRGRGAAHALNALNRDATAGRPCVLENHRNNFIFDADECRRSLAELDALCAGALRQHPDLRFLTTVELGRILRARDPQWIVQAWRQRLPWVWQRVRGSGRAWKLMRLTGLALAGAVLVRLLGQPVSSLARRATS